jgi:hypothetical protein
MVGDMARIISLSGYFLLASSSTFAQNSVVIEQVGAGKVIVQQSGDDNSAKITQKTSPESEQENAPYLAVGEKARATSLINQQAATENQASSKGIVNKIDVKQSGKNNSATLSQSGDDNDLLLKQEGKNNHYKKSQKGKHNRAKVIQNDELIEKDEK